jgi:hypothetical protein
MSRSPRDELISALDDLSDAQLRLVFRMANAMKRPVTRTVLDGSRILTPEIETAIANQLVLHHATHEERLNKKSFEYLFKYANEAANRSGP